MAGGDLTVLIAYSVAVAAAVAVSLALALSTRRPGPVDAEHLAETEKRWLIVVVVFLVALLGATIWFIPYGDSSPSDAQVVQVDARQFFWTITPARVTVDRPVAFVTRSEDVNHGFGIYKGHRFVAQIQVVPKRGSTLRHTFHETGTYTVLCLEFCGVGHGAMRASFEVTK